MSTLAPAAQAWGAIRIGRIPWEGVIYACLALIPVVAFRLPGSATQQASDQFVCFADLAGPLLFLLLLVRGRIADSRVLFLALAFLACAALSVLQVDSGRGREVLRVYRLAALYAPFLLALSLPWTPDTMERALRVFWWCGLAGIALGLGVYWFVGAVREKQQVLWLGGGQGTVLRAGGLLGNSGGFSHLVTGWAAAALCLRWVGLGRLPAWQLVVTLGVLLYGVIVTASRASLLQAGVAAFFTLAFVVRSGRSNIPRISLLIGVAAVIVLMLVPIAYSAVNTQFLDAVLARFGIGEGVARLVQSNRYANWAALLHELDWTWLGIGYKHTIDLTGLQVDNSYLRIFLELGIPGVVVYLLLWMTIQLELLAGSPDPLVRRVKAAAAGLAMGELARMFFADTFTMPLGAPAFLILVAMSLRLRPGPRGAEIAHG